MPTKLPFPVDGQSYSVTIEGRVDGLYQDINEAGAIRLARIDEVTASLALKADLVGGLVPAAQLPAYVDDVLEYADFASLPVTGETAKIYVTLDNNKTYRWSGSAYVVISDSLALGETESTAHRGDHGKTAYDHSQTAHAPANAQKNSDILKSEIEAVLTDNITSHDHISAVNAQTGTAYTLVLTDVNNNVTMNNPAANTVTIPANASVAFIIGTKIDIDQLGAGVTTLTGATGVTVNGTSAGSVAISAQYGGKTLKKIATDTWLAQ